eukprot:797859-Prymnesium_polylepis.1
MSVRCPSARCAPPQSLLCIVAFGLMLVAGLLVAPRLPIATWQVPRLSSHACWQTNHATSSFAPRRRASPITHCAGAWCRDQLAN